MKTSVEKINSIIKFGNELAKKYNLGKYKLIGTILMVLKFKKKIMSLIKIDSKIIGKTEPTFIADIAANHDGD